MPHYGVVEETESDECQVQRPQGPVSIPLQTISICFFLISLDPFVPEKRSITAHTNPHLPTLHIPLSLLGRAGILLSVSSRNVLVVIGNEQPGFKKVTVLKHL